MGQAHTAPLGRPRPGPPGPEDTPGPTWEGAACSCGCPAPPPHHWSARCLLPPPDTGLPREQCEKQRGPQRPEPQPRGALFSLPWGQGCPGLGRVGGLLPQAAPSPRPPGPCSLQGPEAALSPTPAAAGPQERRQAGRSPHCPGSTRRQPGPGIAPVPHAPFSSPASVPPRPAAPHKADRTRWGSVSSSQAATGPTWPLPQRSRRPDLPRPPLEKVLMHIRSLCGSGSLSGTGPRV